MNANELPDDIVQLKKMLLETVSEEQKLKKLISAKDRHIQELQDTICILQRKKYAPSSEASKDQLGLFNELETITPDDEDEEQEETITYTRKKRGKRAPLPDSLPRIEKVIVLPAEERVCPHDGKTLEEIGEEVNEQLEIIPAKVQVIKTIRKKYACPACNDCLKTAPAPKTLLPKTMATSSLIAYIITAKYMDALPLYRQEKIFERVSAALTRQTMARWLITVSEKLIPLYNLLQDKLLLSWYLQMDETTTQVLKEDGKKATSKSYMWVRHAPGDNPIVLFDYAPTRAGQVPLELLQGFKGFLQVDGYDGYALACREYGLHRLGCMDHCRRKFFDASKTSGGKSVGKKGVSLIDKLYKIEEKIKYCSPEERHQIRQDEAVPQLGEIKSWIDELRPKITPNSVAGKAIHYAFNEWQYLVKYTQDSRLNISNTWIENAIRPFAIGRRNWLFSDSVDGANASAMYYSLIETAKKNGLEPFDYLTKMLDKLPSAETVEDFEKLLPLKSHFQV